MRDRTISEIYYQSAKFGPKALLLHILLQTSHHLQKPPSVKISQTPPRNLSFTLQTGTLNHQKWPQKAQQNQNSVTTTPITTLKQKLAVHIGTHVMDLFLGVYHLVTILIHGDAGLVPYSHATLELLRQASI